MLVRRSFLPVAAAAMMVAQLFLPDPAGAQVSLDCAGDVTIEGLLGLEDRCESWTTVYDEPDHAGSYQLEPRIAASDDGGVVFVSAIDQIKNPADPYDSPATWTVLAYDGSTGGEIWRQKYAGPGGYDRPGAIAAAPDGSVVVVTGGTYDAPLLLAKDRDLVTIAFDGATGEELWRSHDRGAIRDLGVEVLFSKDGSQVFAIVNVITPASHVDWAVVAYDAQTGAQLWRRPYSGVGLDKVDSPKGAALSPDGDLLYVTGESGAQAEFDADYATVAYRTEGPDAGEVVWEARYDGGRVLSDRVSDIAVDAAGRVIVTGDSLVANGPVDLNYATVAYDGRTGDQLWATEYTGPIEAGYDFGRVIVASSTQEIAIVSGQSEGADGDYGWGTVAYDTATGQPLWEHRLETPNFKLEFPNDAVMAADGATAIFTGISGGTNPTNYRDLNRSYGNTLAYDIATGGVEWLARITGNDETDSFSPRGVVATSDGSAFVAGQLTNNLQTDYSDNLYDAMVVAYRAGAAAPVKSGIGMPPH